MRRLRHSVALTPVLTALQQHLLRRRRAGLRERERWMGRSMVDRAFRRRLLQRLDRWGYR